ncbi:hypothetical protein JXB02_03840 [Candidatus Woesearchaeota archaeon]|nr:hypothetical protein [Candidatus Woesearchaeota archaeon]
MTTRRDDGLRTFARSAVVLWLVLNLVMLPVAARFSGEEAVERQAAGSSAVAGAAFAELVPIPLAVAQALAEGSASGAPGIPGGIAPVMLVLLIVGTSIAAARALPGSALRSWLPAASAVAFALAAAIIALEAEDAQGYVYQALPSYANVTATNNPSPTPWVRFSPGFSPVRQSTRIINDFTSQVAVLPADFDDPFINDDSHGTNTWKFPFVVNLSTASYTFYTNALDSDGNTFPSDLPLAIIIDTTPPRAAQLLSAQGGRTYHDATAGTWYTNASAVQLQLRVENASTIWSGAVQLLAVSGSYYPYDASRTQDVWTPPISLLADDYTDIPLTVTDYLNNSNATTVAVYSDLTPPSAQYLYYTDGMQVGDTRPQVQVNLSDAGAGVNASSVVMSILNANTIYHCTCNAGCASVSCTDPAATMTLLGGLLTMSVNADMNLSAVTDITCQVTAYDNIGRSTISTLNYQINTELPGRPDFQVEDGTDYLGLGTLYTQNNRSGLTLIFANTTSLDAITLYTAARQQVPLSQASADNLTFVYLPTADLQDGRLSLEFSARKWLGAAWGPAQQFTEAFVVDTEDPVLLIPSYQNLTSTGGVNVSGSFLEDNVATLTVSGDATPQTIPAPANPFILPLQVTRQNQDNTVTVTLTDRAGASDTETLTITWDSTLPQIATLTSPTHPNQSAWYNISDVQMQWGADTADVAGYSYLLTADPALEPDTDYQTDAEGAFTTLSSNVITFGPSGTKHFAIRAVDAAGNWGPTARYTLHVDDDQPGATLESPASHTTTNDPRPTIVIRLDESVSGIDPGSIVFRQNSNDIVGYTYDPALGTISWQPPADDTLLMGAEERTINLYLEVADLAGNRRTLTDYFTISLDAPGLDAIDVGTTGLGPFSYEVEHLGTYSYGSDYGYLRLTFDEPVRLLQSDLQLAPGGCTIVDQSQGFYPSYFTVYVCRLGSVQEGPYALSLLAADMDANVNPSITMNWTLDHTPPAVSLSSPADGAVLLSRQTGFGFVATDTGTQGLTCALYINGTAAGSPIAVTSGIAASIPRTLPSDGPYTWRVGCTDAAGPFNNAANSTVRTLSVDTNPPQLYPFAVPAFTNQTPYLFAGVAFDAVRVHVFNDQTYASMNTTTFSSPALMASCDVLAANGTSARLENCGTAPQAGQYLRFDQAHSAEYYVSAVTPIAIYYDLTLDRPALGSPATATLYNDHIPGRFSAGLGLIPGANTIEMTAIDAAGNTNGPLAQGVFFDGIPPALVTRSPTLPVADNTTVIRVEVTDAGSGILRSSVVFTVGNRTYTCASPSDAFGSLACPADGAIAHAFSFTPTGLPDGSTSVSLTLTDRARNSLSTAWSFTIDPDLAPYPTFSVSDVLSSDTSGAEHEFYLDQGSPWVNFTYAADVILNRFLVDGADRTANLSLIAADRSWAYASDLAEGHHTIDIYVNKSLGSGVYSDQTMHRAHVTIDSDDPTISLAALPTTAVPHANITVTFSDLATDRIEFSGDIQPSTHTIYYDGLASGQETIRFNLTSGDGNKTVVATIHDYAGHTANASVTVLMDTAGPVISSLASPTHPDQQAYYAATDVNLIWTVDAQPSGVGAYVYAFDQNATSEIRSGTAIPTGQTSLTTTVNVPSGQAGTWYFHLNARDNAGTWGVTRHYTLNIDRQAPSVTFTGPGQGTVTNDPTPTITYTIADAHAGVNASSISFLVNNQPVPAGDGTDSYRFDEATGGLTYTPSGNDTLLVGAEEATVGLRLSVRDLAGAQQTADNAFTVSLNAPDLASVMIGDAGTGPFHLLDNAGTYSFTQANRYLRATFDEPVELLAGDITVNGAACPIVRSEGGSAPFFTSYVCDLGPLAEASYSLVFRPTDEDGNINPGASFGFSIDRTGPAISIMSPDDGAISTLRTMPIVFTATDGHAGALSCGLLIDGTQRGPLFPVTSGLQHTFTSTFTADGAYGWQLSCTDLMEPAANPTVTPARTITVDTTDPQLVLFTPRPTVNATPQQFEGVALGAAYVRAYGGTTGNQTILSFSQPVLRATCSVLTQNGMTVTLQGCTDSPMVGDYVRFDGLSANEYRIDGVFQPIPEYFDLTLDRLPPAGAGTAEVYDAHIPGHFSFSMGLAQGENAIGAVAFDAAGNSEGPATVSITYDDTRPDVVSALPAVPVPNPLTPIQVKMNDTISGIDRSSIIFTLGGMSYTCASPIGSQGTLSCPPDRSLVGTLTFQPTGLSNGTVSPSLIFADYGGNVRTHGWSFLVDPEVPAYPAIAVTPLVSSQEDGLLNYYYTNASAVTITVNYAAEVRLDAFTLDGSDITAGLSETDPGRTWTYAATLDELSHEFRTTAAKHLGAGVYSASVSHTFRVVVDSHTPDLAFTLYDDIVTVAQARARVTWSDQALDTIAFSGPIQPLTLDLDRSEGGSQDITFNLTGLDGTKTIVATATDHAGLATVGSDSVVLDREGPALANLASSTHPSQAAWYTTTAADFSWTVSPDTTGIAAYSYRFDTNASTVIQSGDAGLHPSSTSLLGAAVPANDGQAIVWYFHLAARDNAGLWGATRHYTLNMDRRQPDIALASPVPRSVTNDPTPLVRFSLDDDYAGVDPASILLYVNGIPVSAGTGTDSYSFDAAAGELTYAPSSPGILLGGNEEATVRLQLSALDLVGNGPAGTDASFIISLNAPDLEEIGIATAAAGPYAALVSGESYSYSAFHRYLRLTFDEPVEVTEADITLSQGSCSLVGTEGPGPAPYYTTYLCDLGSLGTGGYDISIAASDADGNTNPNIAFSFSVDRTEPTVTLSAPADGWSSRARAVNFTFVGTDAQTSSLSCQLYVGGTPRGAGSAADSGVEERIPYAFSADGTYDWEIRCADASPPSNNVGVSGSRVITVDTQPPALSLFATPAWTNVSGYAFEGIAVGAAAGTAIDSQTGEDTPIGPFSTAQLHTDCGFYAAIDARTVFLDGCGAPPVTGQYLRLDDTYTNEYRIEAVVQETASVYRVAVDRTLPASFTAAHVYAGHAAGHYTFTLQLAPGRNDLLVDASDAAGNTLAAPLARAVSYDGSVPSLVSAGPTVPTANPQTDITADVNDTVSGILRSSIRMTVNDITYACGQSDAQGSLACPTSDGFLRGAITFRPTGLPNGTTAVSVNLTDQAGNGLWHDWSFLVDPNVASYPSFSVSSLIDSRIDGVHDYYYTDASDVWINFTYPHDVLLNSASLDLLPITANLTAVTPSRAWAYQAGLTEGEHDLAIDVNKSLGAGVYSIATTHPATIVVDTQAPTVAMAGPAVVATDHVDVTVTFSDLQGAAKNITFDGGIVPYTAELNGLVSGTLQIRFNLTGTDGLKTIDATIHDYAGHSGTAQHNVTVDRFGPVISGLASPTHPNASVYTAATNATFTWAVSAEPSGIQNYAYVIDQLPTTPVTSGSSAIPPNATSATVPVPAPFGSVGTWHLHLNARDNAGTWGATQHYGMLIDRMQPNITLLSPAEGTTTNNPMPTIIYRLEDLHAGLDAGSIVFMIGNQRINATGPGSYLYNSSAATLTYTPQDANELLRGAEETDVNLYLAARDNAGNDRSSSDQFTISLVASDLAELGIYRNADGPFAPLNHLQSYSYQSTYQYLRLAFDEEVIVTDDALSLVPDDCSIVRRANGADPYYREYVCEIPGGLAEGQHTLAITTEDHDGNINDGIIRQFSIDRQGPAIALDAPADGASSTQTAVAFSFTAADSAPQADCAVVIDGTSRSVTRVTAGAPAAIAVNLPQGVYGWAVNCSDLIGPTPNTALSASRTLVVDTTPPALYIFPLPAFTNQTTFIFEGTVRNGTRVSAVNVRNSANAEETSFSTAPLAASCNVLTTVSGDSVMLVDGCTAAPQTGQYLHFDSLYGQEYRVEFVTPVGTGIYSVSLDRIIQVSPMRAYLYQGHIYGHYALPIALAEGDNTIYFTAYDAAGNSIDPPYARTIGYDGTGPQLYTHSPQLPVSDNRTPLTITVLDAGTGIRRATTNITIVDANGLHAYTCTSASDAFGSLACPADRAQNAVFSFTPAGLATGNVSVSIAVEDYASNGMAYSWTFAVDPDLAPYPSVDLSGMISAVEDAIPHRYYTATPNPHVGFTYTPEVLLNGFTVDLVPATANLTIVDPGHAWSYSSAFGTGRYDLSIDVNKSLGSGVYSPATIHQLEIIVDDDVPQMTLSAPAIVSAAYADVSVIYSDLSVRNITFGGDIVPSTRDMAGASSGSETVRVNFTGQDGNKTVTATIHDYAGHASSATIYIISDTIGPSITGLASSTHPVQTATYGTPNITLSWTIDASPSGVAQYSYTFDQNASTQLTSVRSTLPADRTDLTATVPANAGQHGTWYFHLNARDNAGTWGATQHYRINLDLSLPTAAGWTPSQGLVTREVQPDISVTLDGTGTAINESALRMEIGKQYDVYGYTFINYQPASDYGTVSYSPATGAYALGTTQNLTGYLAQRIYVRVTAADGFNTAVFTSWFDINQNAPNNPLVVLSDGQGSDIEVADAGHVSISQAHTVLVLDYRGQQVTLTPSGISLTRDGAPIGIAECTDYSGTVWLCTMNMPSGLLEGSYALTATATRMDNNVSGTYTHAFVVDRTPPSMTGVVIDSGAAYTNQRTVQLALSASDSLSDVTQMMVSENADFSGAGWVPFTATANHTFVSAMEGVKAVYARFRDAAGVATQNAASDTIIYDITPPALSLDPIPGTQRYASINVTGSVTSDNGRTILAVASPTGSNASSTFSGGTASFGFQLGLQNGTNTIIVTAADDAGNTATTSASVYVNPSMSLSIAIVRPDENANGVRVVNYYDFIGANGTIPLQVSTSHAASCTLIHNGDDEVALDFVAPMAADASGTLHTYTVSQASCQENGGPYCKVGGYPHYHNYYITCTATGVSLPDATQTLCFFVFTVGGCAGDQCTSLPGENLCTSTACPAVPGTECGQLLACLSCENGQADCICGASCVNAGATNGDCGGVLQACGDCANHASACVCGPSCINAGSADGLCGGICADFATSGACTAGGCSWCEASGSCGPSCATCPTPYDGIPPENVCDSAGQCASCGATAGSDGCYCDASCVQTGYVTAGETCGGDLVCAALDEDQCEAEPRCSWCPPGAGLNQASCVASCSQCGWQYDNVQAYGVCDNVGTCTTCSSVAPSQGCLCPGGCADYYRSFQPAGETCGGDLAQCAECFNYAYNCLCGSNCVNAGASDGLCGGVDSGEVVGGLYY